MNRKQKKSEKAHREAKYQVRRRKAYERVLSVLGLDDWFHDLQDEQKDAMVQSMRPKPIVKLDASLSSHETDPTVRRLCDSCGRGFQPRWKGTRRLPQGIGFQYVPLSISRFGPFVKSVRARAQLPSSELTRQRTRLTKCVGKFTRQF
jgi:hypothetical protein